MTTMVLSAARVLLQGPAFGRHQARLLFPLVAALNSTDARPKNGEVRSADVAKKGTKEVEERVGKSVDTVKAGKVLAVGDSVSVNKLVSVGDVNDFCELTGDYNTVHTESRIVHGALLNALVSSVIGTVLPGPGTVVLSQTLHFPAPCVAPQGVVVDVEITSVRKIIGCQFSCRTIDGVVVLRGDAKLMKKL